MFICCLYGDTILVRVALLHLLFYTTFTWMVAKTCRGLHCL